MHAETDEEHEAAPICSAVFPAPYPPPYGRIFSLITQFLGRHDVAFAVDQVPDAHAEQLAEPGVAAKVPAVQTVQDDDPEAELDPAGHAVQVVVLPKEKEPAAQAVQLAPFQYVPMTYCMHE